MRRSSRKDGAFPEGKKKKKKVDTLGLGYLTYEARDEGFPLQNEKSAASPCFVFWRGVGFFFFSKTHKTTSYSVIVSSTKRAVVVTRDPTPLDP